MAAGGITESLILAKAAAEGIKYQPGWILGTDATVKVFIDIFIGIWAFVLGWIWTNHINKAGSDKAKIGEIWERFPEVHHRLRDHVRGRALPRAWGPRPDIASKVPAAIGEANAFRVIFFVLTFFSIGVLSNFRKLWQEGIGKLAAVYRGEPVRVRDLGRALDLVAVLRRHQAAAGRLNLKESVMSQPNISDELRKAPAEPLLPIEKQLIGWSLGIGVALLIVLAVVNHYFPVTL